MKTLSASQTTYRCVQIYLWITDSSLYKTASWVSVLYMQKIAKTKFSKRMKRHDSFWSCSLYFPTLHVYTCSEKHIRVCQVLGMRGDICMYMVTNRGVGYVCFCDMSYVVMQVLDTCMSLSDPDNCRSRMLHYAMHYPQIKTSQTNELCTQYEAPFRHRPCV